MILVGAAIVRESLHLSGRMANKVQDAERRFDGTARISPWGESKSVDLMPAAGRWNIIFFQAKCNQRKMVNWHQGHFPTFLLSAAVTQAQDLAHIFRIWYKILTRGICYC